MRAGQLVAGRYRLEEELGAGGMGVVWRATDEELGRRVAVKQLHADDHERAGRRARREARTAAGLHHPRVVMLFDMVTDGGERWLVMEYVPSKSLAELIERHGSLPPRQVAGIGAQIAEALAAVHARDAVHGDVKPGNVLVTEDGIAKLADFGVSRAVWAEVTLTDDALVGGTPAYLSPEAARGEEPTPASDVFALGATLFAAVEGRLPYGDIDNPRAHLRRAAEGDIAPFRRAGPLVPALSAMLKLDPADRPDAARAQRMLAAVAEGRDGVDDAGPRPAGGRMPCPRWSRRTVAAVTGAAAVVVAVAVALSVFLPLGGRPHEASGSAAAGSTGPSGAARPLGASRSSPVVGDPRTADPCALTDSAALERFGGVDLETAYGNFNRCDVIVQPPAGDSEVDVMVELDPVEASGRPAPARAQGGGAVLVDRQPEDGGECVRTLTLTDHNLVAVVARRHGPGSADLCAMADVATESALAVLDRGGEIPRRSPRLDPAMDSTSLARVDACTLLDADALAVIPGVDATDPEVGFGSWECRWHSTTSDLSLLLRFDRSQPLTSADGRATGLAGHRAFIQPEGDGGDTCLARVVHRTYTDRNGDPTVEMVFLVVRGAQPVPRLCRLATDLSRASAAELPPA